MNAPLVSFPDDDCLYVNGESVDRTELVDGDLLEVSSVGLRFRTVEGV